MYNPYQKNGNLNTIFHLSCLYNKINLYLLFFVLFTYGYSIDQTNKIISNI